MKYTSIYVAQKTQRSNAAVGPRMDRTQFLVQLRAPTTENRNVLQDNGDKNLKKFRHNFNTLSTEMN